MPDPEVKRLHAWLGEREQELLDDYRRLLQIPSIEGDPAPNAPFGPQNREALDFMLGLARRSGMRVKDLDGYIGYAEFGQGERLVMSIGHLDVVPVGPGWKHEPFGAEVDDGYVYARGAVDDKGPTIASFYAMRAIRECIPEVRARMRSLFGCNEESGFRCIEHYVKSGEETPTFGIAPDSGWPLYHAEKGIANFVIETPLIHGALALRSIRGGQRPNIVIDRCESELTVDPSVRSFVSEKLAEAWDKNVEWSWTDEKTLKLIAKGKAAHGSTPFLGDSAAIRLARFLSELSPLETESAFVELLETMHIGGAGIGISCSDEPSRDLTANVGIVETQGENVRLTINVRYPVTIQGDSLRQKCERFLAELKRPYVLASFDDSKPLYFPLEHPLVKTICEVYEAETGEKRSPGVMGGGTYARALPNSVSIGTGWEGDGKAHETDERCKIEHLFKMSRIYAHILYRLSTLS